MFRFRRLALWMGCALLTVGFVAAEELAGAAARTGARQPVARTIVEIRAADSHAADAGSALDRRTSGGGDSPDADASVGRDQPVKCYRICRVTAYCDRGTTAAGVPAGPGQCAAPADIPFGSRVYIPALGRTFIVTDRTHRRFRHNTVDLFIPSRRSCRAFGRQYLKCEFTIVDEPPAYGRVRVPSTR